MTILSSVHAAPSRAARFFGVSELRAWFLRFVAAWKVHEAARAEQRIDNYYRRLRNQHERFLSQATDHYNLERLERAWERREDMWRVY